MNRRDFLVRTSLASAAGLLARPLSAQPADAAKRPLTAPAPANPEFKTLRRQVGTFTARGGTIGWLANSEALAAVDTQFPDTAAQFLEGLPDRRGRRFDVVINSHHHPDHVGGNGVLKPAARMIVAHANVPALQRARAERDNSLDRQTYADTTFPDTWRRELGDEVVSAKYHGPAHTKGDIVTHFEKANVIHMGDLMFNRIYPVIDRAGGASIRGWIGLLEQVARTYPADAIYIFGHANPKFSVSGGRQELLTFRDFLTGLLEYTQKQITAGAPKEKIVSVSRIPGFDDYEPQNRTAMALGVAYDELTEKRG